MKTYKYTGSLRGVDIDEQSYILHNGNNYDLPEDDEKVKAMIRKQELTEVEASVESVAPSTDPPADPPVDPPADSKGKAKK